MSATNQPTTGDDTMTTDRTTIHYGEILRSDRYGDMFGPTACEIPAGTYCTDHPERVTCPDCLAEMIPAH